ncbi:NAD-dependent protein deacetylase [Clostridia bacterium]|nr:NAD-dependent protein deacetylase [Clostridia bacterium]
MEKYHERLVKFKEIAANSENIVFFGGAGVSTESGIPDFRSQDGLYNQSYKHSPETIISKSFFYRNTSEFYRFYKDKMLYKGARPNPAHIKLAELERDGKLLAVITQNIDNLHQEAGSKNVLELHGSVHRNFCQDCGRAFAGIDVILDAEDVPRCACGGIIKPDVVLYEEPLAPDILEKSIKAIEQADTLIIGGTSLVVYPAAGLVNYFHGKHIVVINKAQISANSRAELLFDENIGKVFGDL